MLCEHPRIPSGFWTFLTHFLIAEIIGRYVLSLAHFGLTQGCENYVPWATENDAADSSFVCGTVRVQGSIALLVLLLACIYLHEYRMKRLGDWEYGTQKYYDVARKAVDARAKAKAKERTLLALQLFGSLREKELAKARAAAVAGAAEAGAGAGAREGEGYALWQRVEISLFAQQLRLRAFCKAFWTDVIHQVSVATSVFVTTLVTKIHVSNILY
jgi:hypothetical protein